MKIIYLANVRIPTEKAHGVQIMKMCQALTNQGVNLQLVVAKRSNPRFKKTDSFGYYQIEKKFPIKRLWLIDMVALGLKGLSIIQNTSFAFSAFFYLLFKKADIIYSRDEFSIFFLSFFRKNLVWEIHAFPNSKLFLYKWIFKRLKKIVVINKKIKELIVNIGIEPEKILVAHDGVDLEQFKIEGTKEECRQKLSLPLDQKLIVYTGHLFRWKGVYTLAEASRFLDGLVILVGGMGEDKANLEEFIKTKHLNVLIMGHQLPRLVPLYLKAADVLVLPNSAKSKISRLYTSPMKMFEYMASGIPIVASDIPSIREVLNKKNAVLVKPDNSRDLAKNIEKILKNAGFYANISKKAYQDVQKYTWQKRSKNILKFVK